MKCEKCGKEDFTVQEYTWMFAKELNRVLTATQTTGTKRTDTFSVYRSGFQPVSVSICAGCTQKERITTGLIPGLILSVLTLICAGIFISRLIEQKPGEGLGIQGYLGVAAILLVYLAIDRFSVNSNSITLEKAMIKANKMGMTILQNKKGNVKV